MSSLIKRIFNKNKPIIKGRKGFYEDYITTTYPYSKYVVILYVIEVEMFENNLSRVVLENVEIKSGDDPDKFEYIKLCASKKFISIVNTDNVKWLVPTLITDRRDKIIKINKI